MIGCDADRDSQFAYIEHLRKAFKMEPRRHLELFEAAEARPRPPLLLGLTIAEARRLATKDAISGSNDPFCTVYVRTSCAANPQVRTKQVIAITQFSNLHQLHSSRVIEFSLQCHGQISYASPRVNVVMLHNHSAHKRVS